MSDRLIYDISVPISESLPTWPGDPGLTIEKTLDVSQGDLATVSQLRFGSHTGTHVDAFSHFKRDGQSLDQMDLSIYVGKTLVVEIEDPEKITLGELQRNPAFLDLRKTKRVLFKTVNSQKQWYKQPFNPDFCYLSPSAASFLAELGIQLVGVDALSVDSFFAATLYDEEAPTHHRLMDAGIYIVEGLSLETVSPGWYELVCLPLPIDNGDGAPARVILRDWVS